ncbi:MAG: glycosyl hydrolase family 65 protein [bacterium]
MLLDHTISAVLYTLLTIVSASKLDIPDDFPRFKVSGNEKTMDLLRQLYYLHYVPAGPMATLWDEWLSGSSLWPAVSTEGKMISIRKRWSQALSSRKIDSEGYVATHQHASIAHQDGWPFPFWKQGGPGTWGWHFSLDGVPNGWHGTEEKTQEGWELWGGIDNGISDRAWNIELTSPNAYIRTMPLIIHSDQSPFIQLRWRASGLEDSQPYLEWITEEDPNFSPEKRFYFHPITESQGIVYTMIPVFRSPLWNGKITKLGINFGNKSDKAKVGIQALFTQYDTRHNINNQNFIRGCCQYFWWTRDLNFLRNNLGRIRLALLYLMNDLGGKSEKCIIAPFPGHCGRSGIERLNDGTKIIHSGRGIGNNYWDLLPMGYKDAYATIHYYDTLKYMAILEKEISNHPEWNMPLGPLRNTPEEILKHAEEIKSFAGQLFWNKDTGRFVCGIDINGKSYDYGFTFINCEAIYYDFATEEQAKSIMEWLDGERTVEGDTSQGKDIYRWRFGPRSTTKRNIDYYGWFWNAPETIPWGGQVQDGGAVLGFSYHDLQSRLIVLGADNAWSRLKEIVEWFDEVQQAGGYREYYKDGIRGTTLQGGGQAGGLGLDYEFFESILVPQIMINGFMGFKPRGDGFEINPRLPKDWSSLEITQIHLHDMILDVSASKDTIIVKIKGQPYQPFFAYIPVGKWKFELLDNNGNIIKVMTKDIKNHGEPVHIQMLDSGIIRFIKQ